MIILFPVSNYFRDQICCFLKLKIIIEFVNIFGICDAVRNLKNVKNTHGGALLLVKLQASACNFIKSNVPPWVFFTFFKWYKWYQIVQSMTYVLQSWFFYLILLSTKWFIPGGSLSSSVTSLFGVKFENIFIIVSMKIDTRLWTLWLLNINSRLTDPIYFLIL